jgi:ribosomal-protein-alanine N-acetyltransferase
MTTKTTDRPLVKDALRVHHRWIIRRDMPEVLDIERDSFPLAWTEEDFLRCLRQRNQIGMVAELGDKIVGYMIYALHKSKVEVLNFAVHSAYRRRGVGEQMVAKLVGKLAGHRRTRITLITNEQNLRSQLFWQACGFEAIRVERGYYEATGDDGYVFCYRLREPGEEG